MPGSLKLKPSFRARMLSCMERKYISQTQFAQKSLISRGTISKFFTCKPIDRINFEEICHLLEVEWSEIADRPIQSKKDLRTAPELRLFYGRESELANLSKNIDEERINLIGVFGVGGIGKTILIRKLVEQVSVSFEYIIWLNIREPKEIESILLDIIKFVSDNETPDIPENHQKSFTLLISYLKEKRCLIVLDNLESILLVNEETARFQAPYQDYEALLERIENEIHQSCFVITSREKPRVIDNNSNSVFTIVLKGLKKEDARELIRISQENNDINKLIQLYEGHPLALKLATQFIQESHISIAQFIEEVTRAGKLVVFDQLAQVLDWHFARLSEAEQEVMYWLAINREPTSHDILSDDIISSNQRNILKTIESLFRKSLIENTEKEGNYTLQNVIMEYMTLRLVITIIDEIKAKRNFTYLKAYALIKATSKDYVRDNQIKLIFKPIIDGLENPFFHLSNILIDIKIQQQYHTGYVAGNLLNMLCYLSEGDNRTISNYDFSGLTIRQAYLQDYNLHNIDFSHANIKQSTFTKTFGSILALAFSPDGKYLATGDGSGDVCLWDVKTGQKHFRGLGHTNWITCVTFTPDGKNLLSSSEDHTLRLWSMQTGQCLKTYQGHDNWVLTLSLSPDGKTVASGSSDHSIKLWDIETGQCFKSLKGHDHWVSSVKFTKNGQCLLSASYDNSIKLWNLETGECVKTFTGHNDHVLSLSLSPSGENFASSSDDRTIKVWNIEQEQAVNTFYEAHTDGIGAVSYSPDENNLASSAADGDIKIWEIKTGKCLHILSGHTNWLKSVSFSPDSQTLASGSGSQGIRIWDAKTGECLQSFSGKVNWLRSIAFSPNHLSLASGGVDGKVRIWDINTGQCITEMKGHSDSLKSVIYSPNGLKIASSGDDYMVRIWDATRDIRLLSLKGHTNRVLYVVFSQDGRRLASGSEDNTLKLWDATSGECLATLTGHDAWIQSVRFSPDGQQLVTGSSDFTIKIWDITQKNCIKTLQEHTAMVRCVLYTSDGRNLISCSDDKTIRYWDSSSGKCLRELIGHTNWIWEIALSPDGKTLVSGGEDNTVRVWNLETGKCNWIREEHTNWVRSVAFSFDGTMVASGSEDETIKIWDAKTGNCLKTLRVFKPYEGLNIKGVQGLTEADIDSLKVLGAIQNSV